MVRIYLAVKKMLVKQAEYVERRLGGSFLESIIDV